MNRAARFALVLSAFPGALFGFGQTATDKQPSAEEFLRMKSFPILMPLSVSADGKKVAYTLQDGSRVGESTDPESMDERPGSGRYTRGCAVWISDIASKQPTRISDPAASSWAPTWSPDGWSVAFFSDSGGRARPWVWNRKTGQVRPIADIRPKVVMEYDRLLWTADGESVLFRATARASETIAKSEATPSVLVLDSPQDSHPRTDASASPGGEFPGVTDIFSGNLVQVDVGTGEIHVLTEGQQIYSYWPSPAGRHVAFTRVVGYEEGSTDWTLFDIVVKDLHSGEEVIVAHKALLDNAGSALSWSPDASRIAYGTLVREKGSRYWEWSANQKYSAPIGDAPKLSYPHYPVWNAKGDRLYVSSSDAVYVFDLSGQPPKIVQPPNHLKIAALFASHQDRVVWSDYANGDAIYVAERNADTLELEIHRLRLSNGSDERLANLNCALAVLPMEMMEGTRDGKVLVFPMESAAVPQDLWAISEGGSDLRQLTHVNPRLEQYEFPGRRVIRWVDFDGHELRGTLVMPSGYIEGHKYPLIVEIYGGDPESRWGNQFSATSSEGIENMQLFATRGYAAFVPDTFMGTDAPMLDLYKSLIPGIEKVVATGIADENAIGIMGHSYGAYSVYSLLVQTRRFRAAVALSGTGNLISNYGEMDPSGFPTGIAWAEKSQGRMGDSPWKVRDKYIENSPFFYLDRVETPILIAHGGSDWHPAYEDREIFVGLRRLGKTAEYAEYRGGGHRIGGWSYANQLDLTNRVITWFDKYLVPTNKTPTN